MPLQGMPTPTPATVSPARSVLIVDSDARAAYSLATRLRLERPALVTLCAHTAHAALVSSTDLKPDVIIIDFGSGSMSGELVAGAIFVACPAAKPLMIALSGPESRKRRIQSTRFFDHIVKKPFKVSSLATLIAKEEPQARSEPR